MYNLNKMFPEKRLSPVVELGCVAVAAVLSVAALAGYGVWKIGQFICNLGRKDTWI